MTGNMDTMAKTAKMRMEFRESASPEDVSLCRVVPAWMATKDSGATPAKANKQDVRTKELRIFGSGNPGSA
jgi:hypothetical protein